MATGMIRRGSGSAYTRLIRRDRARAIAQSDTPDGQPQSSSNQAVADALSLLSDLFSETAHDTWTKGEVVEVIEDFIKVRCPDTRPVRETQS